MKYNIVEIGLEDIVLASCNSKEIAEKYLKEMYEVDKELQKSYNWNRLPKYKIVKSKRGLE